MQNGSFKPKNCPNLQILGFFGQVRIFLTYVRIFVKNVRYSQNRSGGGFCIAQQPLVVAKRGESPTLSSFHLDDQALMTLVMRMNQNMVRK